MSHDDIPPTETTGISPTDKDILRRAARAARRNFVAGMDAVAHRLAFRALPNPIRAFIAPYHVIALYAPMGEEAPALRLAKALTAEGKILCLPHVVDRLGTMEFRAWAPGDVLEEGAFGIIQPPRSAALLHPDVIFAPLLAFDSRLMRLGQGGGYYDRIFARYEDALRIGVAWSAQQVEQVPADPWDVPLHRIMTESSVFEPAPSSATSQTSYS